MDDRDDTPESSDAALDELRHAERRAASDARKLVERLETLESHQEQARSTVAAARAQQLGGEDVDPFSPANARDD